MIQKLQNKRNLIILLGLAILLLIIVLTYRTAKRSSQLPTSTINNNVDLKPATPEEKQQVEDNKINGKDPNPSNNTNTETTPKSVTISQAQYDTAQSRLVVQTQLQGAGWQKCTLQLTQGSQTFSKTSDVLYQPEFSTCLGFTVNAGDFPTGGTWNIVLSATNSDGLSHVSDPKSTNITK